MNLPTVFCSPAPYPEIENATVDHVAVREIKLNYCSQKSETVATLQYVYHHFVSNPFAKDIANVFMQIGKIEMRHMDVLAEAMTQFGGDPVYIDPYGVPLSGRWVYYTKSLKHMLQANLDAEIHAAAAYRKSARIVENRSLQHLFLRLAEDEDVHVHILKSLLEQQEFWGR